ncbi:hypothetical protein YIM73518_23030 [Thermus brockianus]
MSQLNLPPDMPEDIRRQIEDLAQKNPGMAQGLLRLWEAKRKREAGGVSWNETPAKTPQEAPEEGPPSSGTPDRASLEAAPPQRPTLANTDWREVRRFEWQDLLAKAERTIEAHGYKEVLGPLFPLVRLLVAYAIGEGARLDPSREAHVFLPQWEVAQALEVSERTVERWLNDPRYERYRRYARHWIAWETWMTSGRALEQEGAVRGGTVWRVRVRPVYRAIRVLAPYLRLPWRDLEEDRREGRTARVLSAPDSMSGYKEGLLLGKPLTLRIVVGKPLATWESKKTPLPLDPDTRRNFRELLRLSSVPGGRNGRRSWAQQAASAIAAALGDQKSVRFWLRVVWAALKQALFGGGEGAMRVLARVVGLAAEARADGFARSPGAYAQALLRREGYWDLVAPFQAFRAGVPYAG